jgi:folate-binding protein YgfZ
MYTPDSPVYFRLDCGLLLASGPDQDAFLQRQVTNDLRLLKPGLALPAALTNPAARILDVLYLLRSQTSTGEDALAILTLPGRAEATTRYLRSRIFFMDKVALTDRTADFAQLHLFGPQTDEILAALGYPDPQAVAAGQVVAAPDGALAFQLHPGLGTGWRLVIPTEQLADLEIVLQSAGAQPLDPQEYHTRMVEAGLPQAAAELSEAYTPLETGLAAAVSDSKGCYTGQEILARQITYDKVTQLLCGLRLSQPAAPGDKVWADGRVVGTITSAAISPAFGPIALAVIRKPHHEPGTSVQVGTEPETASPARIAALPFV